MRAGYRRVPAIDKCFVILGLLAQPREPMAISDISGNLDVNKSTVFNIGHTLSGLKIVELRRDGKFVFGTHFYILRNIYNGEAFSALTNRTPYLEMINERTRLSAFLRLRFDRQGTLIDKADSTYGIKVSMDPGIKAMPSQFSDEEIDEIFALTKLKRYTHYSVMEKTVYIKQVPGVRKQCIINDREKYISAWLDLPHPLKQMEELLKLQFGLFA
jgi:DNA-binding IclR family transcriptional regulator